MVEEWDLVPTERVAGEPALFRAVERWTRVVEVGLQAVQWVSLGLAGMGFVVAIFLPWWAAAAWACGWLVTAAAALAGKVPVGLAYLAVGVARSQLANTVNHQGCACRGDSGGQPTGRNPSRVPGALGD